ncbi:hypothetical protein ATG98_0565 [Marinobacter sp. LV10R520-4]|uniref:hypothetical protein n=1 Tax=Marinobacter sp. LV10R520-4 TaxID=1761796 RepID=UPI000BF3E09F|nr:hypothetical protein [Marinobacter sp. LV10R520-4]PFG51611.1 hypothetical protein ATG98_0565 [Marinobacter sp. LV10R520-4]
MLRKLLLSTAISVALLPSVALAQGLPAPSNNYPRTTGQQIGPNDAGGQASVESDKDEKQKDNDKGTKKNEKSDEPDNGELNSNKDDAMPGEKPRKDANQD